MARVKHNRSEDGTETSIPSTGGIQRPEPGFPMSDVATTSGVIVLRLPAVCRITGLGRSTIYRMQTQQQFPQRIKLGARAVGWVEREVQEWLANCIENSRSRNG
jgi:prophage regulatory protein